MPDLFLGKVSMLRNFTEQCYDVNSARWGASYSYGIPKSAQKSVVYLSLHLNTVDLADHTPETLDRLVLERVLAVAAEYRAQFPEQAAEFDRKFGKGDATDA